MYKYTEREKLQEKEEKYRSLQHGKDMRDGEGGWTSS